MRVETAAALAPSFEAGADLLARIDEGAATAARLAALAGAALTEALSHAGGGGVGGGNAIGELRALLRSSGVVGPAYYSGPRWLPHAYAAIAFVGGGCADAERAAFRAAVLSLCAELRHGGAARAEAGTPPPLLSRLLNLLSGAEPAPRPFAPCRLVGGAVEAGGFGADEVRVLLSTAEEVRPTPTRARTPVPSRRTRALDRAHARTHTRNACRVCAAGARGIALSRSFRGRRLARALAERCGTNPAAHLTADPTGRKRSPHQTPPAPTAVAAVAPICACDEPHSSARAGPACLARADASALGGDPARGQRRSGRDGMGRCDVSRVELRPRGPQVQGDR